MITPLQWNLFITTVNNFIGEVYTETDASLGLVAQQFTTEIPSGATQEAYGWTGMLPKPRPWNGPRVAIEPAPQTYIVVNRAWEGPTVTVDQFQLDDDKFGIYYRFLPDQARQARRWRDYSTRDLLEGSGQYASTQPGNPQNCTDGTPFFGTAHLVDFYAPSGTTFANDFVGGLSVAGGVPGGSGSNITVGGQFSQTSVATVYEYMLRMLGEDGEPLGVVPDSIVYPVQLELEVTLVLKTMSWAPPQWGTIGAGSGALAAQVGAADNPLMRFGLEKHIRNPYLTSATKFYMADTKRAINPIIWQVRESATYSQRVNPDDPVVFDSHRYLYGVWGRATAAFMYPFLMVRSGT